MRRMVETQVLIGNNNFLKRFLEHVAILRHFTNLNQYNNFQAFYTF